jgi:hypothetical protein
MAEGIKTVESNWNKFIKVHWGVFTLFVAACVAALVGAVYVFTWFAGNAQTSGLVPTTLAQWTMGNIISFLLNMVFWELVFVGIPLLIGVVIAYWWWRRLPADEKAGYHLFGKHRRGASGDGGSFLFFIAFCIKVYIDGNWNTAISSWTFDYVVSSSITIFVWALIIFSIPTTIAFIWWIQRGAKKEPLPNA